MNRAIIKLFRICILFVIISLSYSSFAQDPPPPPGGASGGTNTDANRQGAGAPIGGGLFILLGLGAAYGGFKGYKFYKKKNKSMLD